MENPLNPENIAPLNPESPTPQAPTPPVSMPEESIPQVPIVETSPLEKPIIEVPAPEAQMTPQPQVQVELVLQPQAPDQWQNQPPLVKKSYRTTIITLSVIIGILLIVVIFLYVKFGGSDTKSEVIGDAININGVNESTSKTVEEIKRPTEEDGTSEKTNSKNEIGTGSKDLQRLAHLNTAATGIMMYYSDREQFPEMNEDGCFGNLVNFTHKSTTGYFPKWYPKDPQPDHTNEGCNIPWEYAYRSFKTWESNIPGYALSATMEDSKYGNSAKPLSEYSDAELWNSPTFEKWSGVYYIITN